MIRPVKLIIYDNLKKKIYFIINCFKDQKITNYNKKFNYIKKEIINLIKLISLNKDNNSKKILPKKVKIKSNKKKKSFLTFLKRKV